MRTAPSGAQRACLALLLLALAPACGDAPPRDPRPQIVVSLPPLAWFVERLAGDRAAVSVLLPPGANPHSFEPGLAQIEAASKAALLVELGHPGIPFEEAATGALLGDRYFIVTIRAASDPMLRRPDPHLWLSPRLAREMMVRIAGGLAAAFPSDAAEIRRRHAALDTEIAALDTELRARLAPYRGRAFLAYHPDWTAFAEDYDLRQLTLEQGHREPDAANLRRLIEVARSERIRALFVQPQFSGASAELVAGEIGARVVSIDPLSRDWPGTLRRMTDALVESFAP